MNSTPPELKVLCRKLSTYSPSQLPANLPCLSNLVLRCKTVLSASQDHKPKDSSSETSRLVHKYKASLNTLLTGRSREGRFAATALVKASIDVGGWEILSGSEVWVRGMLDIMQKADPVASKELAVIALTRIYTLLHPYQTLVREIATPTLPAFATACLSLLGSSTSHASQQVPLSAIETIVDALSVLIPLYPSTLRPFASKIKSATRTYLAPTRSQSLQAPSSLQTACRRLLVSLHYVAAKSEGSEEWFKMLDTFIRDFHLTADQVFRAVDESWEPSSGPTRTAVDPAEELHGGGDSIDELPPWTGLDSGCERLSGLLSCIGECLKAPTKAAVSVPVPTLMDLVSRLTQLTKSSPKTQTWEQALSTKPAIGRDEKDELWANLPHLHIEVLRLLLTIAQRLHDGMLPHGTDLIDHMNRVFISDIDIATVRQLSYELASQMLPLIGPSLPKSTVQTLDLLIKACCRDLQEHARVLPAPERSETTSTTQRSNGTANADLFLKTKSSSSQARNDVAVLSPAHVSAAQRLLVDIFTYLPQQHLKPSHRSLLDKTAILIKSRDAMLASVLNPFKDQKGRQYPSILPHLSEQFPQDPGLEILRTNLRNDSSLEREDRATLEEVDLEEDDGEEDSANVDTHLNAGADPTDGASSQSATAEIAPTSTNVLTAPSIGANLPAQNTNLFQTRNGPLEHVVTEPASTANTKPVLHESLPKRKLDEEEGEGTAAIPSKRQETATLLANAEAVVSHISDQSPAGLMKDGRVSKEAEGERENSDDDDDESVHLNMELEFSDEDEDSE